MRLIPHLLTLAIGLGIATAHAQVIDLERIVEIRGYPPPPDMSSPSPRRANPTPVDLKGKPQLLVFVVNHDFVIFQLRNLCANPPPGYQPQRKN